MFINIIYKDVPELSSSSLRRLKSESSTQTDNSAERTLLVNPKCPVRIMLEYIRNKCKLGIYTHFDLCDETGALKGLFNLPTYAYATDEFEHKKTYYLIVIRQEDKRLSIFPQLNHENRLYADLQDRVKKYLTGNFSATDITKIPSRTSPSKHISSKTTTSKSTLPTPKVAKKK